MLLCFFFFISLNAEIHVHCLVESLPLSLMNLRSLKLNISLILKNGRLSSIMLNTIRQQATQVLKSEDVVLVCINFNGSQA